MPENKLDGKWELSLQACGTWMRRWKRSYFRKNSRQPAKIMLRCWHAPDQLQFWKYYLELHRKGKVHYQERICPEAYDVLARDMPKETMPGVEFITLETFIPENQ